MHDAVRPCHCTRAATRRQRAKFGEAWNAALDEVEAASGAKALVTTGTGKFYSNGLDLDYMMSDGVDSGEYLSNNAFATSFTS